ncbi:MAG: histidine phosphatase family protein [Candidatus Pelagadaptatus aseana]|uniref:SixA phosphatase family protein n=1 Tax=Candidatus Pelagadaptatus aseana TaxID=3120508 RepID=UPI0039B322C3
MKTIHLIRHGKSSWDDYQLTDMERPLKQRGIKDCEIMAPYIAQVGCKFTHTFVSPARRAEQTMELLADHLDTPVSWQIDERLYTFDCGEVLAWLRDIDNDIDEVVVVGHNPALTDLHNLLTGECLYNLPTCGYLQLQSSAKKWQQLKPKSSECLHFIKPKQFK